MNDSGVTTLTVGLRDRQLFAHALELDLQLCMLFPESIKLIHSLVQPLAQRDCRLGAVSQVRPPLQLRSQCRTHPSPIDFPLRISSRLCCNTSFSRCAAR